MKTRVLISSLVLAGLALSTSPRAAFAGEGVVIAPSALRPADRSSLEAQVALARASNPASFQQLARVRAQVAGLDATKRGRLVPIPKILASMGRDALLPMLEQIAVSAPPRGAMTDTAWTAWRAGLIEAVGALRDSRAAPVLLAILQGGEADFLVVRAAAAAYGKLGSDDVANELVRLSRVRGPRQTAILAGMGHCRRASVANELARVLNHRPGAETAVLVARSLGDVGSAWAWETPSLSSNPEGATVRAIAAQSLLDAYLSYDGEVRTMTAKALMVVHAPSTSTLVSAARST
ncbi:MAG: hypothetical protein CVU63_16615, partial [Deltaproteobacteria bacterium HGW-Deltaproteobacteria-20]